MPCPSTQDLHQSFAKHTVKFEVHTHTKKHKKTKKNTIYVKYTHTHKKNNTKKLMIYLQFMEMNEMSTADDELNLNCLSLGVLTPMFMALYFVPAVGETGQSIVPYTGAPCTQGSPKQISHHVLLWCASLPSHRDGSSSLCLDSVHWCE